ncbi:conjugative transposon protein TraJ [Parapedobacter sp. DT-150]|uniref:conjugative transposon protein TraJ n=1 Tax=Parapedobacter sp. DT-150 TaxID=3396162 RepID=UPI003F1C5A8F
MEPIKHTPPARSGLRAVRPFAALSAAPVILAALAVACLAPSPASAQSLAGEVAGLHGVLDSVRADMLPLCGQLIGVGRGLAGFAALWYIASRVWRQIAHAEAIDFYPLLRPFAIGLAILFFPLVIGIMDAVLSPIERGTGSMVENSDGAVAALLKQKEEAAKNSRYWEMYVGESGTGDADKWYKYTHPEDPGREDEGFWAGIGNDIKFWMDKQSYNFRNSIKKWMSEVLQVVFMAAALCINTIRTFFLIVLAIMGPLVLGLSVFDGLQHTLTVWIARYINVFLWLPVANIFGSIIGKIQEEMLKIDIQQIGQEGDTFFSATDTAYLVFLIIGILGYFSVPSVANYIVHAGGSNALMQRVNTLVVQTGTAVRNTVAAPMGMAADALGDGARQTRQSMATQGNSDYFPSGGSGHQHDRISGK